MNEKVKLDKDKLGKYRNEIITTDVILTEERIKHIKGHHPNDYEQFGKYIKIIIEDPDYILEDNKNLDTVIYLKKIIHEGKNVEIVVKLNTNSNNSYSKNSILTLWKVKEKTYKQLIRNKVVIYKKE